MTILLLASVSLLLVGVGGWLFFDGLRVRRENEAWKAELASITDEEREAATEMLMDTLARNPHYWSLIRSPEYARRIQSKEYAQAALRWKQMKEQLAMWRTRGDA